MFLPLDSLFSYWGEGKRSREFLSLGKSEKKRQRLVKLFGETLPQKKMLE